MMKDIRKFQCKCRLLAALHFDWPLDVWPDHLWTAASPYYHLKVQFEEYIIGIALWWSVQHGYCRSEACLLHTHGLGTEFQTRPSRTTCISSLPKQNQDSAGDATPGKGRGVVVKRRDYKCNHRAPIRIPNDRQFAKDLHQLHSIYFQAPC